MNNQELNEWCEDAIKISNPKYNPPPNFHFMIGNRRTKPGEKTWVTTGNKSLLKKGDKIIVESLFGDIVNITEERPTKLNRIFQKIEIQVIHNELLKNN